MIYLAVFFAFLAGYLTHMLQNQLDGNLESQSEVNHTEQFYELTHLLNQSQQLNVALLEDKFRLQLRLQELQYQHERTLAALN